MRFLPLRILLASCFFALTIGVATAAPYIGTTALAADQTLDFEGLSVNVAAGSVPPVTFTNWFSGPYTGADPFTDFGSGQFLGNHNTFSSFTTNAITSSFTFGSIVSSASFEFVNFSNATITSFLGGTSIESYVYTQNFLPGNFIGFQGILFDTIEISSAANPGGSDFYMDNLGFTTAAAVPEIDPSSATIPLALCLGMLLLVGDRRPRGTTA